MQASGSYTGSEGCVHITDMSQLRQTNNESNELWHIEQNKCKQEHS